MDPATRGAALHRGAAGGRAALRVGAAEAGGWNSYQGMVYCWDISTNDYTNISLGDTTTLSPLYST